ncbi:unnamed protein product [Cylindrotheca closterium]|uniref:Pseudouridine synthase I TruA alpha/beta domain-containing protein n=1 Tax=Cylindrotheca closterium TaxID=2856 RepID=A0AAD2CIN7_9STRA|nr:unnamed protein product [Cylindrotheca closterium]
MTQFDDSPSQANNPAGNRKRKLETKAKTEASCCCSTCNREFQSRNQLFQQLRASNNGCCDPNHVASSTTTDGALLSSHRQHQQQIIQHKRVVLIVAYLGKNYHGSARNDCTDSVPTVEGCLWKAIGQAFPQDDNETIRQAKAAFQEHIATKTNPKGMTRSSRTDKGVSALGNVFSLMLPWVLWSSETIFEDKVNSFLPNDIRLLRAMSLSLSLSSSSLSSSSSPSSNHLPLSSLDARSHCEARRYRYFVPAQAFKRTGIPENNNESLMDLRKRLKQVLLQWGGTHSFHNFTNWKPESPHNNNTATRDSQKSDKEKVNNTAEASAKASTDEKELEEEPTFFRHILRCHVEDVIRHNDTDDFLVISIKGQSFLYHQIRKMMGTTIAIMNGSLPADFIIKAFQEKETLLGEQAPLAPSEGLVMVEAMYSKYCSKHNVEPIGLGSKLFHREKKKTNCKKDKEEEASRRELWQAASAKLLADTRDFEKRVYDQVCQDQLRLYQESSV